MKLGIFRKFVVMKNGLGHPAEIMPEGNGKSLSFLYAALFLLFLGLFSGCGNKFFDPLGACPGASIAGGSRERG